MKFETKLWHPNISMPHLCPHGRPFAVGTTLDVLCLMVGQMVQFQIYNPDSALNPEAAAWAHRTILLGDGRPVADAPTREVLGGGWYFATQTARLFGGGGVLTPEDGAALIEAVPA